MLFILFACSPAPIALDSAEVAEPDAPDAPEDLPAVQDTSVPEDPSAFLFDPTRIADVQLTMQASDWTDVRDNPWAENWQPATLTWDGEEVGTIGVRAFGAGSLVAGKPSLKVSFDKWVEGQEYRGLDEVKLDNASQDAGFLNEFLATSLMRRAGVPAARTGWARVTVNGAAAGFFVVLESIDDRFVERWFGHDDGVLYGMNSGYWGQGLNPMEDGLTWFEPQTSVEGDGTDLVALADVVANGSDAELAAVLDLEGFARESIARSVLGSMDAFSADGNNYYLYDDAGVWRILPWDFDVDLGGYYFSEALTVDPRAPWHTSPWSYNPQTGADYEDPVLKRQLAAGLDVDAHVAELLAGPMAWEDADASVAAAAQLIGEDARADVFGRSAAFDRRRHDLRLWLHARFSALLGRDAADCPPLSGTPLSAMSPSGTVGWGELLVDRTYWGPGFSVAGEHACTGAFAHAPSVVTVTVPAGASRLVGRVGLQDWNQDGYDGAAFSVVQGGRTLWESGTVRNYAAAVAFDVPVIPGALELRVSENGNYYADTAVWLDVEAR